MLAAGGGFVIAAALWWIYFDFVDSEAVVRSLAGGLTYTYAHFPLVAGFAALRVRREFAILVGAGRSEYDGTGWILCVGLALAMFALAVLEFVTPPTRFDTDVWLRVATGAAALALVPAANMLSPPLLVWILALVLGAQVLYELAHHPATQRRRESEKRLLQDEWSIPGTIAAVVEPGMNGQAQDPAELLQRLIRLDTTNPPGNE